MDITRAIIGAVVTEKAERLKGEQTYTLHVAQGATKVDVRSALKKYYDVDVASVRAMRTTTKVRATGRTVAVKRRSYKKMLVTLAKGSKPLDISAFKA